MSGGPERNFGERYRVERLLGAGGMGSVYLALDTSLGRRVAIKVMAADSSELERFRDEAFSLAALQHPNIVEVLDFHVGDGDAYMVMELVDGETLHARLAREGKLAVDVAIDIAKQTLAGLAAAHARGIIHRDVKPANLLLHRGETVKIVDFGLAKLRDEDRRRKPTTEGTVLGTPAFMAPEQASASPVDERTDVHAVGLCLYTMLTGTKPFASGDAIETMRRVIMDVPARVDELRPEVPEHVADAIAKALAKAPSQRFDSAVAFASALDARPQPIEVATTIVEPVRVSGAAEPATPRRPRTRRRRIFLRSLGASVLGLSFVAAGVGLAWRRRAPEPAAAPIPPVVASFDAGEPAPPPPEEDAAASEPVAVASTPIAPPPRGRCSCMPSSGDQIQPNNSRLAPAPSSRLLCWCRERESTMRLCASAPTSAAGCARQRRAVPRYATPCKGFDVGTGEPMDGVLDDCEFDSHAVDVYAGPPGRSCIGYTFDGRSMKGVVRCFGR